MRNLFFIALLCGVFVIETHAQKTYALRNSADGSFMLNFDKATTLNDVIGVSGEISILTCTITIDTFVYSYEYNKTGRIIFWDFFWLHAPADFSSLQVSVSNISAMQTFIRIRLKGVKRSVEVIDEKK